ncbi:helix-turn-helix domain-containing protein [Pseudoxanthomonas sp.]|uniref:GlxA family transcriptional regulator n=1 Tax=Pseudoxanthomonas sp. TaxID=1871049 RepID=UPI00262CF845|nr:helix-turn-helix domain-containing protein [Pseudoxanthomonas sp.]WDS35807.1 MAG: helix-turn-helix domain-containing protein [Pseudoxanthomonas sp.]
MKIVVVGSDGCLASGYSGLVDLLGLARQAIAATAIDAPLYELVTASHDGQPFRDGQGVLHQVDSALADVASCNALVVPGFVPDQDRRPPDMALHGTAASWIRAQHARGAMACGSCSGAFLLGEAGLLDNRRCTTTWWLHEDMKRRYPLAGAIWGTALLEDGRVVSAGGPLSWIDVALHVIRRLCGNEAARIAADFTVVDATPNTKAAYIPLSHFAAGDTFLARAESIVRRPSKTPITASMLAQELAVSERTLHRRLIAVIGQAPKKFIDHVRFQMARDLLETGGKSIKELAFLCGYADDASFRRAFKRAFGKPPGACQVKPGNSQAQLLPCR